MIPMAERYQREMQVAPSYDVYFANEYERSPVEHKNDFMYPVNRWHARDGINREKLLEVFGEDFGVC